MNIVTANIDINSLYLVNKCDLKEIIKTGIVKKAKKDNDYSKKVYLISNSQCDIKKDNLLENVKVLLLRDVNAVKLSDSPKKVWKFIKSEKQGIQNSKYKLEQMSIRAYMYKKYDDFFGSTSVSNNDDNHKTITSYDRLLTEILGESLNYDKLLDQIMENSLRKEEKFDKNNDNFVSYDIKKENIMFDSNSNNLNEKIKVIVKGLKNNNLLIISERKNKIYLPYTIDELENYIKCYPLDYLTVEDVIEKEFIISFDSFLKHPFHSRFSETYNLMRNREKKSSISALIYAIVILGKNNLNPAVIAACKSKNELLNYINCLKSNRLDEFKSFKTIYEPISA